jgi:hypothetical protein
MSAPPGDVVDRLDQLAAHAPAGGIDPDAVWTHGRRRQRVRLGAALAALVVVGLLGTTTTPLLVDRAQRVEPAGVGERMVLPDLIRQPGGWEPAFSSAPGRLSAVGFGTRSGLWSTRPAWWGVSAATGESRFLELPGAADIDAPALSADGWRLAYWVTGEVAGEPLTMSGPSDEDTAPAVGVAVLDLRTGARDVWRVESEHGLATNGLAWAGDVLWWAAGPISRADGTAVMGRDIAARTWDVTTGERDEPTGPSARVSANTVGDAPDGFVEQAGRRRLTLVTDGAEPRTVRLVLPAGSSRAAGTVDATVAPDGARLAALLMPDASRYDEARRQLVVGPVGGREVRLQPVDGVEEGAVAGWRSPTEVVVVSLDDVEPGRPQRALRAWALDVTTGARTPLVDFSGNTPQVAAEAWTAEVVPAPDAPFAPDPRLVGLGLLVAALVVWRVVVRVRGRRVDA